MQQSIVSERGVNIAPARRDLHERWVTELAQYQKVTGIALFTTSEGGLLLMKKGSHWCLPMAEINGRDAAPYRVPYTVAKRILNIDTDCIQGQPKLVGEVDAGGELFIIVRAQIPSRIRVEGAKLVKGDTCIRELGEPMSPILHAAIEHVRKHHSVPWVPEPAIVQ